MTAATFGSLSLEGHQPVFIRAQLYLDDDAQLV
jgi:hypothetical protein